MGPVSSTASQKHRLESVVKKSFFYLLAEVTQLISEGGTSPSEIEAETLSRRVRDYQRLSQALASS